ncbi:MAG TPA: DUF6767 domain-containing protein [Nocardioidaceae bacterium]
MTLRRTVPEARCPIRPGDACTLCQPGVTGPQDCGLVYLVMSDPDLREELDRVRLAYREDAARDAERQRAAEREPEPACC